MDLYSYSFNFCLSFRDVARTHSNECSLGGCLWLPLIVVKCCEDFCCAIVGGITRFTVIFFRIFEDMLNILQLWTADGVCRSSVTSPIHRNRRVISVILFNNSADFKSAEFWLFCAKTSCYFSSFCFTTCCAIYLNCWLCVMSSRRDFVENIGFMESMEFLIFISVFYCAESAKIFTIWVSGSSNQCFITSKICLHISSPFCEPRLGLYLLALEIWSINTKQIFHLNCSSTFRKNIQIEYRNSFINIPENLYEIAFKNTSDYRNSPIKGSRTLHIEHNARIALLFPVFPHFLTHLFTLAVGVSVR